MGRANYFWTRAGRGPAALALGGPRASAFCLGPVRAANFGLFLTNFCQNFDQFLDLEGNF